MAATWCDVDDTTLEEDDFQEVKDAVSQLTGLWQGFGSVLGLPPATIKEIQATYQDPSRCLDDVLERWLKQDYNTKKFPPPSWRQLVLAVQNKTGGRNPALAKKIAPDHMKNKKTVEKRVVIPTKEVDGGPAPPMAEVVRCVEQQTYSGPQQQDNDTPASSLVLPLSTPCQDNSGTCSLHIYPSQLPAAGIMNSIDAPEGVPGVPVGQACQETGTCPNINSCESSLMEVESQENLASSTGVPKESEHHYEEIGKVYVPSNQAPQLPGHRNGYQPRTTVKEYAFPHTDRVVGHIGMDGGKEPYDCYEPYKPQELQELKLSFGTFVPVRKQPDSNFDKYEMGRFPHGIALIINNETFKRQKIREGTEIDEENLIQTFRYLGFRVEVHRDKKKAEIETIFDEMKSRNHSECDSFVCCLLTHGADGGCIYGSDSEKVELNTLISKLNGANCISLFGKPKLFFIQACRGKGKSPAVHMDVVGVERVESDSDTPLVLPNESDFFFGYATTPTMVAWRDLDNGSWYINELCQTLCEHYVYADLTSMHEIVQRKIAEVYEINDFKQTTENTSRLTKKVYFNNGCTA